MASYVVLQPPGRERVEAATFIRDGFTWLGFLLPPLWLAWHRLWVESALAFVVMGLLSAAGEKLGLGLASSILSLLVSLYVGLEGQGLRIAAFRRRGWHEWGVVQAGRLDDVDTRYVLEVDGPPDEAAPVPRIVAGAALARPAQPGIALGLTHIPGRR